MKTGETGGSAVQPPRRKASAPDAPDQIIRRNRKPGSEDAGLARTLDQEVPHHDRRIEHDRRGHQHPPASLPPNDEHDADKPGQHGGPIRREIRSQTTVSQSTRISSSTTAARITKMRIVRRLPGLMDGLPVMDVVFRETGIRSKGDGHAKQSGPRIAPRPARVSLVGPPRVELGTNGL